MNPLPTDYPALATSSLCPDVKLLRIGIVSLVALAATSSPVSVVNGQAEASDGGFRLESLGGVWPSQQPAVISMGQRQRIDVFMIGYDTQLYHYWEEFGQPFQLESLGGSFRGSASAGEPFQERPQRCIRHW